MAGTTFTETKHIIENTDNKLSVIYTAITASGGDDATTRTLVNIADASDYKVNGSALATTGFNRSNGQAITGLIIDQIWISTSSVGSSAFEAKLAWHADTPIPFLFTTESTGMQYHDYRSVGGLKNAKNTNHDGDIEMTSLGAGTAGDSISIVLQMRKIF
tara:strand:+ start:620 stop:1099 length:480 start_codon:yes stop_codon:yes gene_type:complete